MRAVQEIRRLELQSSDKRVTPWGGATSAWPLSCSRARVVPVSQRRWPDLRARARAWRYAGAAAAPASLVERQGVAATGGDVGATRNSEGLDLGRAASLPLGVSASEFRGECRRHAAKACPSAWVGKTTTNARRHMMDETDGVATSQTWAHGLDMLRLG